MVVLTMLSWLISDSPLCKGGSGGIWERLKIPLNPPFSKGDLKAFSRGLLPTADRLPGTMPGTGRTGSAKKATVCHPERSEGSRDSSSSAVGGTPQNDTHKRGFRMGTN